MKDRAGNELAVGDRVLYLNSGRSTSWLVWGEVVRFTAKKVVIRATEGFAYQIDKESFREPRSVVKPFKA